jgi:hypothetical protein
VFPTTPVSPRSAPQDANELTGVERVHVQWRRMMMLLLAVLAVVAFVIATVGSIVALSDLPLRIRTADLDLRNDQQLQVRARARSVCVGLTRTVSSNSRHGANGVRRGRWPWTSRCRAPRS